MVCGVRKSDPSYREPMSVSPTRQKKMTMMESHGLISLQRNGVIIKLIIDDNSGVLAMVIPQRPHHSSGDLDTDESILLSKEDSTRRLSRYSFSTFSRCHVITHVYIDSFR